MYGWLVCGVTFFLSFHFCVVFILTLLRIKRNVFEIIIQSDIRAVRRTTWTSRTIFDEAEEDDANSRAVPRGITIGIWIEF